MIGSKLQRTLIFGQLGLFPVTGWTSKSSKDEGVNPFGSRRFLDHALACEKFKLLLYHSLHPNTNQRDHEFNPQESGASSKFSGLTSQCISLAVRSSRKAHKSCHPKSRTVGNRGKPLPALLQLRNKSWFSATYNSRRIFVIRLLTIRSPTKSKALRTWQGLCEDCISSTQKWQLNGPDRRRSRRKLNTKYTASLRGPWVIGDCISAFHLSWSWPSAQWRHNWISLIKPQLWPCFPGIQKAY